MICKHCGKTVEPDQKVCPHCGEPLSASDRGNGFWDLAAEPPSKAEPAVEAQPEAKPTAVRKAEARPSRKLLPLVVIAGVLAVVSIVLSIILFYVSDSRLERDRDFLSRSIDSAKEETEKQVGELERSIGRDVSGISDTLDSLRTDLDDVKDAPPAFLRILSSLVDRSLPQGAVHEGEDFLFLVRVKGSVLAFAWEKQSPDGDWTEIEFDEDGRNAELGLLLVSDPASGCCRLLAAGLAPEAEGVYMCVVTCTDGSERELFPARLTVLVTEPAPEEPADDDEPTPAPEEAGDDAEPSPSPDV